jgi:hypothetical protein
MKKIIFGLLMSVGLVSVANAYCEISPTHKIQFCAEPYKMQPGDTVAFDVPGTNATDFKGSQMFGLIKVTYAGKITEPKKGKAFVKNKEGNTIHTFDVALITKDYAAGYDSIMKGTKKLLEEFK